MRILRIAIAASIIFPGTLYAQRRGGGGGGQRDIPPEVLQAQQEQAEFSQLSKTTDIDAKIKLGEQFLKNYPMTQWNELVYNELVTAYYAKKDWDRFYATADKAIAGYPDDVDILTLVGWVMPHVYNPDDPDASKKMNKAEGYEKHALELIPVMPKAPTIDEEKFAEAKSEKLSQAHSGLGLVYFRMQNWEDCVAELQQTTQNAQSADPADLYALAVSLQHLNRNNEAADAFEKCSNVFSSLQYACQAEADIIRPSQTVQPAVQAK